MKILLLYTLFVSFSLFWLLPANAMDKNLPYSSDEMFPPGDDTPTPLDDLIFDFDTENAKNSELHQASFHEQLDTVKNLIDTGISVNLRGYNNNTPLIEAVCGHATPIIKFLLSKKANVHLYNTQKETPLMYAAFLGNPATLALLLAHGAHINEQDYYGKTALMFAAQEGHYNVIHLLLNHKEKEIYVKRLIGYQLISNQDIHFSYQHTADVNLLSKEGTAIDLAARYGHVKCFKLLLFHGAILSDSLTIPTKYISAFAHIIEKHKNVISQPQSNAFLHKK